MSVESWAAGELEAADFATRRLALCFADPALANVIGAPRSGAVCRRVACLVAAAVRLGQQGAQIMV